MSEIKVKRFHEYPRTFMQPGQYYHDIPYDWDGTDRAILDQFQRWREQEKPQIIGITGPLRREIKPGNGHAGGFVVELTVLHEVAQ